MFVLHVLAESQAILRLTVADISVNGFANLLEKICKQFNKQPAFPLKIKFCCDLKCMAQMESADEVSWSVLF